MSNIEKIVEKICETRKKVLPQRSLLVAISGIDGSGKGYMAAKIFDSLGDF